MDRTEYSVYSMCALSVLSAHTLPSLSTTCALVAYVYVPTSLCSCSLSVQSFNRRTCSTQLLHLESMCSHALPVHSVHQIDPDSGQGCYFAHTLNAHTVYSHTQCTHSALSADRVCAHLPWEGGREGGVQ